MGLVLCVYDDPETGDDLDGFQVGRYSDFGAWRDFICAELEGGDGLFAKIFVERVRRDPEILRRFPQRHYFL